MSLNTKPIKKQKHIAIDGKTHRGAQPVDDDISKLHLVHAYGIESGLLLGQEKVDSKSNEINAIPTLLDALYIEGQIVTIDAMGCQKEIAKKIREKKADYVLALKGNQGHFHRDVEARLNNSDFLAQCEQYEIADHKAAHGRQEIRRCYITDKIDWLEGREKWKDLKTIAKVERTFIEKGKETTEARYFICSVASQPKNVLQAVRGHWGIESMHWSLDVVFQEDNRIIWNQNVAHNESTIRRMSLNLLKKFQSESSFGVGKVKVAIKTLRKLLLGDDNQIEGLLDGA